MKLTKSVLCRLFSCVLMLTFVMTVFPFSAFALENGVGLQVRNYLVDENGDFIERLKTLNNLKYDHEQSFTKWKLEDDTIDLWVYSSEMEDAGQIDGSVVPYTYDDLGNKYELTQIILTSQLNADEASDEQKIVLMDSSAIRAATSRDSYRISTESQNLTPGTSFGQKVYYVAFCWTKTEKTTIQEYNVTYDLNLPTDIPEGSRSLYPVTKAGMLPGDGNGSLGMIEEYVEDLAGAVYSDKDYTVSDFSSFNSGTQYTDFLVFNYNSNRDGENYYTFDGWTVKDKGDTVYTIGQELNPDDMAALADGNNDITFVGKWSKIEPMTDDQLQDASAKLTLNALVGVDSQPLITQSVNSAPATSSDVELKENDTISYTVQAKLDGYIIRSSQGTAMTTMQGFAHFIYQVKVDSNLEFTNLDDNGMVTLTFESKNFKPTQTNIEGATISGGSGTWTITFDPKNVPVNGGSPYIEVTMDSIESRLSDNGEPIILRGLNFKAKADQYGVVPKIETSANVVGSMDLHDKAMQVRAYYQSVNAFLGYPDWKDYFDATADTPTAVAHASQFIDYELKEIDLAKDKAGLEANTVVANSEDDKISYPALDKKVQTGTSNGQPIWDDATTAAANDTVSFQLNSNVPQDLLNYITYDDAKDPSVVTPQIATLSEENRGSYELVFHDQMDEAFTNLDGLQVVLDRQGSENDVTLVSGQYTYTTDTGDDCSFHIVIDLAKLYASDVINNDDIQNVTPITVTYTATLASDVAAGKYLNTAWVTYPGEGESEHSTVSVTTYGINIFKYDQAKGVDGTDAGLAGAEFMIYGSDAVDEDGNLKADATPIRENAVVSGDDGHVIIDGLNVGTYYLVETKAPTGYVKSDKPLEVIIPDKVDETTYRAAVNFANSLVPHTGGTGTVMYTVGGLAIIVLAGILLVVYRKSRKKQDR